MIARLAAIRREKVTVADTAFSLVTTPEPDQQHILDLIGVQL